jgi:alanine-synthesizing transaminase
MKNFSGSAAESNHIEETSSWRSISPELEWIDHDRFSSLRKVRQNLVSTGARLIDLSMINPDTPPPRFCLDKLSEFLLKPENHRYSVARGIRKLRTAFADKYKSRFGVDLCPEKNVCISAGTKDALVHTLRAIAQAGDKVLIPSPTYPLYQSAVKLNSLNACFFQIDADEDETLSNLISAIEQHQPKVLILNFPNNPTGLVVGKSFYEKAFPIISDYDVFVINDFVYGELTFNPNLLESVSMLSCPQYMDQAVEIYSMSKAYSIPGWRIGAVLGNEEIVRRVADLKTHTDYGNFLPLQHAAASALSLTSDLVSPQLNSYKNRCELLQETLNKLGFKVSTPKAGACIWAELPSCYANDNASISFAIECLQKFNLLITPGEIFGADYSRFIRLAAVMPEDYLATLSEKFSILLAH